MTPTFTHHESIVGRGRTFAAAHAAHTAAHRRDLALSFPTNSAYLAAYQQPPAEAYFSDPRKPTRAFVRIIWGAHVNGSRVHKVLRDAREIQLPRELAGISPPTINYVYGRDNYDCLRHYGFRHNKLLTEHPRPFAGNEDGGDHSWVHKSEGWLAATSDFKEIVSMDWDTIPLEPISLDYVFEKLAAKSDFGAHLLCYKHMVCPWRDRRHGTVARKLKPSASFVYIGSYEVAKAIRESMRYVQEVLRESSGTEEAAMAWYYDQRYGGFKGNEHWLRHHEDFCSLCPKCWGISKELAEHVGFAKEPLFTPTYPRYKR